MGACQCNATKNLLEEQSNELQEDNDLIATQKAGEKNTEVFLDIILEIIFGEAKGKECTYRTRRYNYNARQCRIQFLR